MKNESFWETQRLLSSEFSKFVLSHPEVEEQIPEGALLVFNLEDNIEFNEWAMDTAHSQKEVNQQLVVVKVKDIAPLPVSRLVNPKLELVSSR